MVRLSAELAGSAPIRLNAVADRELSLRSLKIPLIENLGVLMDAVDTIDLSDNELVRLENFPVMRRLGTLLLANNSISRVISGLGAALPNLHSVVLTHNRLSLLVELDSLAALQSLTHLSLLHNPVTRKPHYRAYCILRFPHLRVLDFQRIRRKEKVACVRLFSSKAGKQFLAELDTQRATYHPEIETLPSILGPQKVLPRSDAAGGAGSSAADSELAVAGGGGRGEGEGAAQAAFNAAEQAAIAAAITAASTAAEVEEMEAELKQGRLPAAAAAALAAAAPAGGPDAAAVVAAIAATAPVTISAAGAACSE